MPLVTRGQLTQDLEACREKAARPEDKALRAKLAARFETNSLERAWVATEEALHGQRSGWPTEPARKRSPLRRGLPETN